MKNPVNKVQNLIGLNNQIDTWLDLNFIGLHLYLTHSSEESSDDYHVSTLRRFKSSPGRKAV